MPLQAWLSRKQPPSSPNPGSERTHNVVTSTTSLGVLPSPAVGQPGQPGCGEGPCRTAGTGEGQPWEGQPPTSWHDLTKRVYSPFSLCIMKRQFPLNSPEWGWNKERKHWNINRSMLVSEQCCFLPHLVKLCKYPRMKGSERLNTTR